MSGYFGNEKQQRLQAAAEASLDFINATPGACQTGRMMGCDDPEQFGWDRIEALLERDGVFGFRLIPAALAEEVRSRVERWNARFDTWDVFIADYRVALVACEGIVSRGLPDGLIDLDRPTDPEAESTGRIQSLMGAAGIVPFSGSMLVGSLHPALTVAVGNRSGAIAAAAHGYLPHNSHSPYSRYAWGGLVAVAEAHRGKGLGNGINARMIAAVLRELDATHVYELVSASNIPSRRMVEACGLRRAPSLVCGVAVAGETGRFTR
jgi:hypothetical protein